MTSPRSSNCCPGLHSGQPIIISPTTGTPAFAGFIVFLLQVRNAIADYDDQTIPVQDGNGDVNVSCLGGHFQNQRRAKRVKLRQGVRGLNGAGAPGSFNRPSLASMTVRRPVYVEPVEDVASTRFREFRRTKGQSKTRSTGVPTRAIGELTEHSSLTRPSNLERTKTLETNHHLRQRELFLDFAEEHIQGPPGVRDGATCIICKKSVAGTSNPWIRTNSSSFCRMFYPKNRTTLVPRDVKCPNQFNRGLFRVGNHQSWLRAGFPQPIIESHIPYYVNRRGDPSCRMFP